MGRPGCSFGRSWWEQLSIKHSEASVQPFCCPYLIVLPVHDLGACVIEIHWRSRPRLHHQSNVRLEQLDTDNKRRGRTERTCLGTTAPGRVGDQEMGVFSLRSSHRRPDSPRTSCCPWCESACSARRSPIRNRSPGWNRRRRVGRCARRPSGSRGPCCRPSH